MTFFFNAKISNGKVISCITRHITFKKIKGKKFLVVDKGAIPITEIRNYDFKIID